MAAKTRKNQPKSHWGLEIGALLTCYLSANAQKGRTARVAVQMDKPKGPLKSIVRVYDTDDDVRVVVWPLAVEEIERDIALKSPIEVRLRDAMGPLIAAVERLEVAVVEIDFLGPAAMLAPLVTGLELALYRYRRVLRKEKPKFKLMLKNKGKTVSDKAIQEGLAVGQAINLARHLTNLPPNKLNPATYADFVTTFFAPYKNLKIEIWDIKKLRAEKAHLLVGVGKGSNRQPRLVRVRYIGAGKKPPVALVGKGITFDTGGFDIKPSSGMRLMKKDMGGAAAVLGTLFWAVTAKAKCNLDVFLALAENSIGPRAMRPSDVIRSRKGLTVEIHNTDAEGRLVLADAMDVAVTQKEPPRCLIDVATLTGAIKVALGAQLAGLFGNDRKLVNDLHKAGTQAGDLNWPMPLLQRYRSQLNSNFADMVNSADGFGGAVTAALFLEKFAGDVPWAHLDIYAWKDSADGALLEAGGSGQAVACLTTWLKGSGARLP